MKRRGKSVPKWFLYKKWCDLKKVLVHKISTYFYCRFCMRGSQTVFPWGSGWISSRILILYLMSIKRWVVVVVANTSTQNNRWWQALLLVENFQFPSKLEAKDFYDKLHFFINHFLFANIMDLLTFFQVTTDSCLSVIAQTFMDSCSLNENILGK